MRPELQIIAGALALLIFIAEAAYLLHGLAHPPRKCDKTHRRGLQFPRWPTRGINPIPSYLRGTK